MDSLDRYKQINFLRLDEVETEIYTQMEIIGDRMPTDDEFKYVNDLIGIAKSLGSRVNW